MWSKGSVVILKQGDESMADSMISGMETGMALQRVNSREVEALRREVEMLRRENFFLKRRSKKLTDVMIAEARRTYGDNYIFPKWADKAIDLITYPILLLVTADERNTGKHSARKRSKSYYGKEGRRGR